MVQRQTIRKNMDMSQNEVPYGGLKSTLNKGLPLSPPLDFN